MILINEIELASELASKEMDSRYLEQAWMIQDEKSKDYLIKEELQDEFNELYDEYLTLIENCKEITQ